MSFKLRQITLIESNQILQKIDPTLVSSSVVDIEEIETYVSSPEKLPDDVKQQICDLIDGKYNMNVESTFIDNIETIDKVNDSLAVIYAIHNNVPIGCLLIIDPTEENYDGIVPISYYELKCGKSLAGRLQQDHFIVLPEYGNIGISDLLRNRMLELIENTFIVVLEDDLSTLKGMKTNEYRLVAKFNVEWDKRIRYLFVN